MSHSITNDPVIAAVLGYEQGSSILYKFGRRDNVGTAAFEDIAPEVNYAGFLDYGVAAPLSIVFDNAEDNAAGNGCRQVRAFGLDGNLKLQIKDYATNGETPVITTGDDWARVWRVRSRKSFDRRVPNIGKCSITSQASGNPLMAEILPGKGSSLTTNFTMPADMKGALLVVNTAAADNKAGEIELLTSEIVSTDDRPFATEIALPVSGGPRDVQGSFLIGARTDIIAQAKALTAPADISLTYMVYVMTHAGLRALAITT